MSVSAVSGVNTTSPLDLLSTAQATKKSKVKADAAASTSTTSTSTDTSLGSTVTGTTFLNLLVKELQNQDPTAPMDSTAMVGQMISLNQLDQLISINQNLTPTSSSTTTTAGTSGAGSAALMAQQSALLSGTASTAAQTAASSAADPNSTLDFSALNIPHGGR